MSKMLRIFIMCAVLLMTAAVLFSHGDRLILDDSGTPVPVISEEPEEMESHPHPVETAAATEPAKPLRVEPEETEETTQPPEAPEPETSEPEATEPEPAEEIQWVNGVPRFFQNDYPDDLYGSGTVENNGCSVTCLAMVATAMTGHLYTPDELAYYFGGWAENNIQRLEMGSEAMKLPFRKAENADSVWPALKEGKYVIVLMNQKSIFTSSQHFILITGLSEDGKIMVNDPNRSNYSNYRTANGLKNGFEKKDILQGYSGAWIYDPQAMPAEPFLYSQPKLDTSHENYPGLTLSEEDRKLLACLIWVEARGECADGQQAVAEIVLNRMESSRFPDTVRGVIYSQGQFSEVTLDYLDKAEPWQAQYQAIDRALHGDLVLEKNVFFYARKALTPNVYKVIGNHVFSS